MSLNFGIFNGIFVSINMGIFCIVSTYYMRCHMLWCEAMREARWFDTSAPRTKLPQCMAVWSDHQELSYNPYLGVREIVGKRNREVGGEKRLGYVEPTRNQLLYMSAQICANL